MKAKVNLRVEIIEGQDAGYILEETNRLVDLQRSSWAAWPREVCPYRLTVEFIAPESYRLYNNKLGHWIEESDCEGKKIHYICSNCGFDDGWHTWKFCPKCGYVMDATSDEDEDDE